MFTSTLFNAFNADHYNCRRPLNGARAGLDLEPRRCVERLAGGGWKRAYLFALPLELHELCLAIHLVLYMDLKANTL